VVVVLVVVVDDVDALQVEIVDCSNHALDTY